MPFKDNPDVHFTRVIALLDAEDPRRGLIDVILNGGFVWRKKKILFYLEYGHWSGMVLRFGLSSSMDTRWL